MENTNFILKKKIELFRIKILSKEIPFKFQPTFFDILMGNIFNLIYLNFFKLIGKIIINFTQMIKNIKNYSEIIFQSFKNLEKKIDSQEQIIEQSLKLNSSLFKQIDDLKVKLNSIIEDKQVVYNDKSQKPIDENTKSKEEFYQGENLRLSNQLYEMNKKYEILKNEINKFEAQRNNMIKKINSINDEMDQTNILTNVFENNIQKKIIPQQDRKKLNENLSDVNEEVKKIFARNK